MQNADGLLRRLVEQTGKAETINLLDIARKAYEKEDPGVAAELDVTATIVEDADTSTISDRSRRQSCVQDDSKITAPEELPNTVEEDKLKHPLERRSSDELESDRDGAVNEEETLLDRCNVGKEKVTSDTTVGEAGSHHICRHDDGGDGVDDDDQDIAEGERKGLLQDKDESL